MKPHCEEVISEISSLIQENESNLDSLKSSYIFHETIIKPVKNVWTSKTFKVYEPHSRNLRLYLSTDYYYYSVRQFVWDSQSSARRPLCTTVVVYAGWPALAWGVDLSLGGTRAWVGEPPSWWPEWPRKLGRRGWKKAGRQGRIGDGKGGGATRSLPDSTSRFWI